MICCTFVMISMVSTEHPTNDDTYFQLDDSTNSQLSEAPTIKTITSEQILRRRRHIKRDLSLLSVKELKRVLCRLSLPRYYPMKIARVLCARKATLSSRRDHSRLAKQKSRRRTKRRLEFSTSMGCLVGCAVKFVSCERIIEPEESHRCKDYEITCRKECQQD